ncbi:hypothetical protein JVT61DRAFT_1046 [Boletus reticuloceps]|uniref:Uncharacterized protein n=1 Tax=Boletus reticuloceps TaxID=495285 RepID=A0A8I3A9L3_9AGAM|nr:hypothetical protein JVT61DRAFT_1046 [Boletus reticuloceps]
MDLIASVSRSSGLEKDGDLLKECTVQEEFRTFIDKKLKTFWDVYEAGSPTKHQIESAQKQKKDKQENILILFRKLREGLFASGRQDGFALEVYETSLYLSVVFNSPLQTTSILPRLVPYIYLASPGPQPYRLTTILILLLHHLVISFPSQQAYLEQIKYLVPNLLERPSAAYFWISALARSLRTSNFVQFEKLSHPDAFEHLLPSSCPISSSNDRAAIVFRDLPRNAIHALVSRLRLKAREEAWIVVRNAYRELSSSDETQMWLGKRLFFDNFGFEATVVRFDEWVREKCRDGHLRPKAGVEGRWMVCKAR